ncbi:MAG: 2-oxoacid:acceptor oxidoreductase subunit alpha [Deltaproteobacteria bacterium]|nr:MAG: 2-oxoacid:acceptor oxidoreductase subunit alpha [Deltaproteobacteria bacterium]
MNQTNAVQQVDHVVIRFAGDSGDGMQLTGTEFTRAAANAGNDIATFPDFPAEIRAPAGTLAGVSGFQLHFSSEDISTPGDSPDVLVAMNPAALKANLGDLIPGGTIIVNTGAFTPANLQKAGYEQNPLEDGSLDHFRVIPVDLNKLTNEALADMDLSTKAKQRCKNFFALGLMFWIYSRDVEPEIRAIQSKFARKPELAEANVKAFKAGYHYGETTEIFQSRYEVKPASLQPGTYRNITGNEAIALGFVTAARLADKPLFLGAYPITPASDILHYMARYKNYDVTTFQAEDEIAGICSAIGAAFGGSIAVTTSSGPGIALKTEAIGLAAMIELPLVIVNIQRGGPSTGLPTKTEQADLLQALYGRNGEAPLPVLAAKTPSDAFDVAVEAVRIAVKYMTPVFLLSDGYLANGSEPWRLPELDNLPRIEVRHRTDPDGYFVYARNAETLAREWVIPGTPGLEHRVGGLEKDYLTGNVSYDPENHHRQTLMRHARIERIASECGELDMVGDPEGDVLVLGWGGTYGALLQATRRMRALGNKVTHVHLRYLNPINPKLGDIIHNFKKVLVPELNMGQLRTVIRAKYLVDAVGYNKVQGRPFTVAELCTAISEQLS